MGHALPSLSHSAVFAVRHGRLITFGLSLENRAHFERSVAPVIVEHSDTLDALAHRLTSACVDVCVIAPGGVPPRDELRTLALLVGANVPVVALHEPTSLPSLVSNLALAGRLAASIDTRATAGTVNRIVNAVVTRQLIHRIEALEATEAGAPQSPTTRLIRALAHHAQQTAIASLAAEKFDEIACLLDEGLELVSRTEGDDGAPVLDDLAFASSALRALRALGGQQDEGLAPVQSALGSCIHHIDLILGIETSATGVEEDVRTSCGTLLGEVARTFATSIQPAQAIDCTMNFERRDRWLGRASWRVRTRGRTAQDCHPLKNRPLLLAWCRTASVAVAQCATPTEVELAVDFPIEMSPTW